MKSKFVRRLSFVVRPSVSQLSLNLMHGFLSNLGCHNVASPGPYPGLIFEFLKKKFFFVLFLIFYKYFSFSLTLLNGPRKITFGIFENLKIEILTNFIRFR